MWNKIYSTEVTLKLCNAYLETFSACTNFKSSSRCLLYWSYNCISSVLCALNYCLVEMECSVSTWWRFSSRSLLLLSVEQQTLTPPHTFNLCAPDYSFPGFSRLFTAAGCNLGLKTYTRFSGYIFVARVKCVRIHRTKRVDGCFDQNKMLWWYFFVYGPKLCKHVYINPFCFGRFYPFVEATIYVQRTPRLRAGGLNFCFIASQA
jgi:hypothetical protein